MSFDFLFCFLGPGCTLGGVVYIVKPWRPSGARAEQHDPSEAKRGTLGGVGPLGTTLGPREDPKRRPKMQDLEPPQPPCPEPPRPRHTLVCFCVFIFLF